MDVETNRVIKLNDGEVTSYPLQEAKGLVFRTDITQEYAALAAAAVWLQEHSSHVITSMAGHYGEATFELIMVVE